jgi:phage terminase large subunit
MLAEFKTSPLFEANFNSTAKVNVNQGGTWSGKTYSILEVLIIIALMDKGCIITVVGQDVPNLKKGAIRDMQRILASWPATRSQVMDYHKSDKLYEFKNGSIIEFTSYDDEQDARSGKRDYLFINEANGITYEIYWQLFIRTSKKVFLDYNPSARFWVHDHLIGKPGVVLFISDHRHNPFLSQEQHDEIEGIPDKELWKVYARGLTGSIKGLIYPNFQIVDGMPASIETVLGLDFGFNHKTALVEVGRQDTKLFWHEHIYQSELTIGDLLGLMKELPIGKKPIYADHSAADKIEDLKRAKYNVHKADKDVKNGLDFVKRHHLYITRESVGLRKEAMRYKYKEVKGITMDEPVKLLDDGMDAGRYGTYTGFRKSRGTKVSQNSEPSPLDWID